MPNPIKDFIEKRRKKISPLTDDQSADIRMLERCYNSALTDLANDPAFYKFLEDGLVERIGEDMELTYEVLISPIAKNIEGQNQERRRVRNIIKSYFNEK